MLTIKDALFAQQSVANILFVLLKQACIASSLQYQIYSHYNFVFISTKNATTFIETKNLWISSNYL